MTPAYALYRRSTSQQDLSIEQQRASVRAWASEHGYEIVREFADDGSGLDTARRREFLTLLQLCARPEMRKADVVLCYDVSRFSRLDPDEAAFHEYSLRRAGVRVIYTHDPGANDVGLAGHLVKSLKRVLSHEFSQKLSQLVRRGHRAHAARGDWSGGRPPYGYRRAIASADGTTTPVVAGRWKARGERVVLVVEPLEAAIVRTRIFEAYVSRGLGIRAIAEALNAEGVPPPAALRRIGRAAWAKGSVWAILRNPIYTGTLVYGKARYRDVGKKQGKQRLPDAEHIVVDNAAPVIVSRDLWDAAQARHGVRRFGAGRPYHRPYLLSGLIECAHCGKRFQAKHLTGTRAPAYYLCGGYVASGVQFCNSPRIPTTYLEDAVLDGIQKRLDVVLDAAELRRRVEDLLGEDARADGAALPELESRLRDTQQRIGRLVAALADGTDELPSVRAKLTQLERDRKRIEGDLAAATKRAAAGNDPRAEVVAWMLESLGKVRDVLVTGSPEERKTVVRTFLQGIRIDAAKRQALLRWYRVPSGPSVKLVAVGGIEPPTRGL
jgi:DNA invertase Pin-like site-specific DNA recombinase